MDIKKAAIILCVALMGASTFAYTLMGPPTAELQKTTRQEGPRKYAQHEDRWGYIFSYSQADISIDGDSVEDAEITRHYLTWGVALDENFNFNVLLGAVSGEMDKGDINNALSETGYASTSDFDGDNGFSYGFNLKSTFHHGEKVDWGAMVQMTWFSTEDTVDGVDVDLDDAYDLQVAIGPTVDMGCWKFYGGAYYYMLDGDLEIKGSLASDGTYDVEEDDNFGAFLGAQFDLNENTDLILEYQQGNDSYSLGASVGWQF